MKNQSIRLTNASIKLRQRHFLEWNTLVANQRMVWKLVKQETDINLSLNSNDKAACFELKKKMALRLTKIMASQREVREQLKVHQQQELHLLKQSIETP